MVALSGLWLPIVLSAVFVFIGSSIVHMALGYHKGDWTALPDEKKAREALRGTPPGNYFVPHCTGMKALQDEAMQAKFKEGPVALLLVRPSGPPTMGKSLVQWFVYSVVVSFFVAYVTSRTVGAGGDYLQVFRVAGACAFLAYAGATPTESIWKGVRWSATAKHLFDGLIYALLTAGTFGWLWP
jgi:hypothetical protein